MKIFPILIAMMTVSAVASGPTKEELLAALRADPSNSVALYNLGMLNYLADDFEDAAQYWKTLAGLEPTDWEVREKLIQAYWGLGNSEAANAEIAVLREAYQSGKHLELNEKGFFICDQIQVGKIRAYVFEYYEPKGKRPITWKFRLNSGEETLDHYLSVGSYPSATEFAREEGTIGPDEHKFHLDGYWSDGSHVLYGFYRNRPPYQVIRKEVQRILEGTQQPVSGTRPNSAKKDSGDAKGLTEDSEAKPGGAQNSQPESQPESQPDS